MTAYDYLIIGAGHNGLVSAAYLAKAGKKVLVLERRAMAGGQLVTENYGAGFHADALRAGGSLRPDIVNDLGLNAITHDAATGYVSVLPDGRQLRLSAKVDDADVQASIRQFSERDAARWPEFVAFMNKAASFLEAAYSTPMPRLPNVALWREGLPLALLAWKLRRLGRKDMFRVIRAITMSTIEFLEEWFESEELKAAVAALGVHGVTLGSMSAGTGYTLMHQWLLRGGLAQQPITGGSGRLADALVEVLVANGGELRTASAVQKINVENQRAVGVTLANGEQIPAGCVLSAADPRHTLLTLVGARELPPEFAWQTQSIKMRGSVATLHLLTNGEHGIPAGTVVIAPTLKYLERAYDAAKYGEISAQPYLEVTTAGKVVSVHFQSAPFHLKNADWADQRVVVEQHALATLSAYFPSLKASVQSVKVITPQDLETIYGLTEGDLNHGQLILDQIMFMRPLPGWSNHKTPIDGLYLCGSGVHGGGGISGVSGRNAATFVLKNP